MGKKATLDESRNYLRMYLLAGIILCCACLPTNFVRADSINPSLYPTNSSPYGISYQNWISKWWQWSYNVPTAQHPRENFTSAKCASGQQGPVWFLADLLSGTQERTCSIPAGKSILLGQLTGLCDTSEPNIHTDQDLRQCSSAGDDYGKITASVDGVPIQNLDSYRTHSDLFNLTIPANNIYKESPPGTYRAAVDGFFLFMHPLPPGPHNVHYTVNVLNPTNPVYNYAADLTYHLIVNP